MLPTPPTDRRWRSLAPLAITVLVLSCIFAAVYVWRESKRAAADTVSTKPPVLVSALVVQPETLPQSVEAIGSLQAVRLVILAPEVAGRVTKINFEAGMMVAEGTPLVQLYDQPQRADRTAAVSRSRFARSQNERARDLVPTGAVAKQIAQQREEEFVQADAAVEKLDAQISQLLIRAPFAGQIGIRRVNPGQYVNAGDALATLTELDQLYANFSVPQQRFSNLRVGGEVTIRTDAFPERVFTATINAIEPVVAADTRNVAVQAVFENPDQVLRPGMYVTVSIALSPRPNTIVVPATAIQTTASGESAYLVRDGKAAVVPVITGQRIGNRIVVDQGLAPGDQLITIGQLRVQPGAAVAVADPSRAER